MILAVEIDARDESLEEGIDWCEDIGIYYNRHVYMNKPKCMDKGLYTHRTKAHIEKE